MRSAMGGQMMAGGQMLSGGQMMAGGADGSGAAGGGGMLCGSGCCACAAAHLLRLPCSHFPHFPYASASYW